MGAKISFTPEGEEEIVCWARDCAAVGRIVEDVPELTKCDKICWTID